MDAIDLSKRYVFAATAAVVVTSDVLRETLQYKKYINMARPLRINSSQGFTLSNDIKYKLYLNTIGVRLATTMYIYLL